MDRLQIKTVQTIRGVPFNSQFAMMVAVRVPFQKLDAFSCGRWPQWDLQNGFDHRTADTADIVIIVVCATSFYQLSLLLPSLVEIGRGDREPIVN